MGKQTTAPSGYPTNFAALLDLIRFGFGIWGAQSMAVILFHAERSTAYGWQSDQHSRGQATGGIYSRSRRQWTRGPAGISHATWSRENNELTIDPTNPNQQSARPRVLRKIRRFTKRGGHAATEYALDWLAVRAAIADWKEQHTTPALLPLLHSAFQAPPLSPAETRGCLPERPGLSPRETRECLPERHTVVSGNSSSTEVSESRAPGPSDSQAPAADTHPPSQEGETHQNQAAEVLAAIEAAYGRPLLPNDPIPGQVFAIAQRLQLPMRSLCQFIHSMREQWQSRGYHVTSPRLFLRAAEEDLIPWIRANRPAIAAAAADEAREAYAARCRAAAPIEQLPAPPAPAILTTCPECHEEAMLDGTCHSSQCIDKREAQRAALRRTARS